MATMLTYRGRVVSDGDVAQIRELIASHPEQSRRGLSKKLCEVWGWTQPNGRPRDMVCRSLMLALHRAGHIELPPVRRRPPNPLARRARPSVVSDIEQSPIRCTIAELGPLEFRQVRRSPAEALFNGLIETHHYLGYTQPVGEQLKYLVYAGERPVACLAWSSAPRHLGPRDRHIGWSAAERRRNIHLVAYNPRFLIVPWMDVVHLASHLLGRMVRMLPAEWERIYGHPVYFAETFVDAPRFAGTCYRAANWRYLGRTTGRGKDSQSKRPNRSLKDVLGYPLVRDYRRRLCAGR
ncbi:DUF4338 domain-containing protein [Candidatus Binatia bacterium]|nr:DUF4338 domain-containing protein [Candidatus Binatia bacterium]